MQLEEEQKCLLKELQTAVERQEDKEHLEELLWKTLTVFQGCPFYTVKNLEFVYEIRGNEMFVNRKDKSITRASISLAFFIFCPPAILAARRSLPALRCNIFLVYPFYSIFSISELRFSAAIGSRLCNHPQNFQ